MLLVAWAGITASTAQEVRRIERFADWEIACAPPAKDHQIPSSPKPDADCRAVQRLTAQGSDETVFAVTIVRGAQGTPVAIVSIPLGGYIAPGIELTVDGKKPYKLLVETCNTIGCHAGFPLEGRIDKELRSGKIASFRLWTAKDEPTQVTISLKGLTDALARLEQSS